MAISCRAASGERNFIERTKFPIFLETILAIEIMQEPQVSLEEKVIPSISKDHFQTWRDPSIFTSIAPELFDRSNETSRVFLVLKSTSHFLPQSTVSRRSDSSSESNNSYCDRADAWYSKKSVGPRMNPWATPVLTGYSCEVFPTKTT